MNHFEKAIQKQEMEDFQKIELAFDLLEDAEIIEVFEDSLFVKVDREMWNLLFSSGMGEI